MSAVYTTQGTIAATAIVTLDPDRSGNFWCDGDQDDVEIQAAFVYVEALGGGSVLVAAGTFSIESLVVISPNIDFLGYGMGITIFELNYDGDMFNAPITARLFYQKISGFSCNGNKGVQNAGVAFNVYAYRTFFEKLDIYDFEDGGMVITGTNSQGDNTVQDSFVRTNDGIGIEIALTTPDCVIGPNVWVGNNNPTGILIRSGGTEIHECHVFADATSGTKGIQLNHTAWIHDCYIEWFGRQGIHINGFINNIDNIQIIGNRIWHCGAETDNTYDSILIDASGNAITNTMILLNNFRSDKGNKPRYHIQESGNVDYSRIQFNDYYDHQTAPVLLRGVNNKLSTYPMQFTEGTTLISAPGSPWGWEIDADTEFALALGSLPTELHQIVKIKIWAVGLANPGADNNMRAQFTGEAGGSGEAYTIEPIDVVDKNCVETNSAVNAVIHWQLTISDDADIGHIRGKDSIQFKALHEGGADGDVETDATFRTIDIEYV